MEEQLLLWLHAHASPVLDAGFKLSHVVGNPPVMVSLALLMTLCHVVRRERDLAWLWAGLGLSTVVIQYVLKYSVLRARPELWPRIVTQDGFSFPSGHALCAATLLPLLAISLGRMQPRWAWPALCASIVLAAWIGLGRLYLGVHWPSDVVAGWTIGILQTTAAVRWVHRRDAAEEPEPRAKIVE